MDELSKIILASSLAMFGGVLVFVIGRLVEKFAIEPYHSYKKLIGDIEYYLIFNASIYSNPMAYFGEKIKLEPNEDYTKASRDFRELAAKLNSTYNQLSLKKFFRKLPYEDKIIKASKKLIFLSNSLYMGDPIKNAEAVDEIRALLSIKSR